MVTLAAETAFGPGIVAEQAPPPHGQIRARRVPFPARAFLERVGAGGPALEAAPWSCFLPAKFSADDCSTSAWSARGSHSSDSTEELHSVTSSTSSCAGRLWELARHPVGCHEAQRALQAAAGDVERESLAEELRGHVREASRCPHANHVVQKCILTLRPCALQFVIDEVLAAGAAAVARHKYGCRILQRLLERCSPAQLEGVAGAVLAEFPSVSRQQYGRYVVQHMLKHGSPEQKRRIRELSKASAA